MKLVTPNIRRAMMVVGGLILVVVIFTYVIFPDVICKSAQENARATASSPDRIRVDPIVETCRGANALPR